MTNQVAHYWMPINLEVNTEFCSQCNSIAKIGYLQKRYCKKHWQKWLKTPGID